MTTASPQSPSPGATSFRTPDQSFTRRLPVGAEPQPDGGVHFRVWAPACQHVSVVINRVDTPLDAEPDGYFSGYLPSACAGTHYWFALDSTTANGDTRLVPDPASRFQPDGPFGPSEVIDPRAFAWTDAAWRGRGLQGQVFYELHPGTFTREGTWRAAMTRLPALADLGITTLELMPIADFAGQFGWGYDGVCWFAPTRLYGEPDDLRAFVDRAHALGLGVILDVVYNHLGPSGNFLHRFSPSYFSAKYGNEWGEALNFDDEGSAPVREYVLANVQYWIDEFHLDGFRLDATQQIFDASADHIMAAIARRARETAAARACTCVVVAENESQETRLIRPAAAAGYALDALWNDDFHHSAVVSLGGRREAYYTDYDGSPREFLAGAMRGFLYQGQYYSWQKQRRGTPTAGCRAEQFVTYLENHDQVANSARGQRLAQFIAPAQLRAITGWWLLTPGTPLFFQGQERGVTQPFLFFADHEGELREQVRKGRAQFLSQFPTFARPEAQALLEDPADPDVFQRCQLDMDPDHADAFFALHRDLLALRRETPAFRDQQWPTVAGAALGEHVALLRASHAEGDRLVLFNLGADESMATLSEPLLAPPEGQTWRVVWSSQDVRYGGDGIAPLDEASWIVPAHCLCVLAPDASAADSHSAAADSDSAAADSDSVAPDPGTSSEGAASPPAASDRS